MSDKSVRKRAHFFMFYMCTSMISFSFCNLTALPIACSSPFCSHVCFSSTQFMALSCMHLVTVLLAFTNLINSAAAAAAHPGRHYCLAKL